MFARTFISALSLLILSACASNPYEVDKDQIENVATIQGYSEHESAFTWLNVQIVSIDDKSVGYEPDEVIPIAPGRHRVVVRLRANDGIGGYCPCKRLIQYDVTISPNGAYRAKGHHKERYPELWIEDLTQNKVVTPIVALTPL